MSLQEHCYNHKTSERSQFSCSCSKTGPGEQTKGVNTLPALHVTYYIHYDSCLHWGVIIFRAYPLLSSSKSKAHNTLGDIVASNSWWPQCCAQIHQQLCRPFTDNDDVSCFTWSSTNVTQLVAYLWQNGAPVNV